MSSSDNGVWPPRTIVPKHRQSVCASMILGLEYKIRKTFTSASWRTVMREGLSNVTVRTSLPVCIYCHLPGEQDFSFQLSAIKTKF